MELTKLNLTDLKHRTLADGGDTFRIHTSCGVFTVTDRGGEVTISCEHQLQVAPMTSNQIAINERRRMDNSVF